MKFTKQQGDTVDRIISGEVFDIPSYLQAFAKGRFVRYDLDSLRKKFEKSENGKTYKVMKDGHSTHETVPTTHMTAGLNIPFNMSFPRPREAISDDEWEYKSAILHEDIPKQEIAFGEYQFSFDFKDTGVFVTDSFNDIVDFISLWAYLKSEALVLEVDKPVGEKDISVYYQLVPKLQQDTGKKIKCEYSDGKTSSVPISSVLDRFAHDILNEVPRKKITSYMDMNWEINKENQTMCSEFIGKKILPNSALRAFQKSKYKTREEISQNHSMVVAWIAIAISVIAIFIGNVFPLLQPSEIDYLKEINHQIIIVSDKLADLQSNMNLHDDLRVITGILDDIVSSLGALQSRDNSDTLSEIALKANEIHLMLSERLPKPE